MSQETPPPGHNAPWYRQKIFWILMSGPIIVVIAAFATLKVAHDNISDMVSDDYYKDGKHINLQIERDTEAAKRHIRAQVLINTEGTAARVFVSGDFDRKVPLRLLLLHPTRKDGDRSINLQAASTPASGDKIEYRASFPPLPNTIHWYVRLEDTQNRWRVEQKWLPGQGASIDLAAAESASAPAAASQP